jgi:3',5'-cyclic AMP phosphodiesterase CpdA
MQTVKPNPPQRLDVSALDEPVASATKTFTLAQLSDPHLTTLEGVPARVLLNKRLLGYLSWRRRRRHEHRREILDALVDDLLRLRPDHIAVTGDLTHLGLPQEFRQARHWLESLGPPDEVTVIPGNHDATVRCAWRDTFAAWLPYMLSDGTDSPIHDVAQVFPSLRVRDGVALIGVSTAVPTPPLLATGRVGRSQLSRLARLLEQTGNDHLYRIVMLHHPPLPGTVTWRKRLVDSAGLGMVLNHSAPALILHGHAHRTSVHEMVCDGRKVPVIGIPSSSAMGEKPGRRARYHLYRISRRLQGWTTRVEVRAYAPDTAQFVAEQEFELPVAY